VAGGNYRDRQYGFESSSFNHQAGKSPIALIITDGLGHYRHHPEAACPTPQHRQLHAPAERFPVSDTATAPK
jgi:hypothetical protein